MTEDKDKYAALNLSANGNTTGNTRSSPVFAGKVVERSGFCVG